MENGNYDAFDVAMAIDWRNSRIAAIKNLKSTDSFNSQVQASRTESKICMDYGIEILADILGMELQEEAGRKSFSYQGEEVYQILPEPAYPKQGGFTYCSTEQCAYYRDGLCGNESRSIEPKASGEFSKGERIMHPVCVDYKELDDDCAD